MSTRPEYGTVTTRAKGQWAGRLSKTPETEREGGRENQEEETTNEENGAEDVQLI